MRKENLPNGKLDDTGRFQPSEPIVYAKLPVEFVELDFDHEFLVGVTLYFEKGHSALHLIKAYSKKYYPQSAYLLCWRIQS